jgi:hypothetical protein
MGAHRHPTFAKLPLHPLVPTIAEAMGKFRRPIAELLAL